MTIYDAHGKEILTVTPDDTSYRHREVMGDDNLVLKFSLAEHVEIPVGAVCTFQGETYTLARPEALTMRHSRDFEYTVTMEGPQYRAGIWKFRNTSDGRVKFSLTALPSEHLQMFVDNMNAREEEGEREWTAGECVEHDEVCVCYDHAYCIEALGQMAEAFGTEWEIDGAARTVHLRKVEYYRDAPLELSYGRGNGLKPDVGRSNSSDDLPVEILYAQGGSDNIDRSKYPQELHKSKDPTTDDTYGGDGTGNAQNNNSGELLLPPQREIGYDGESFFYKDGEGWDGEDVRHYVVDGQGYYVRRSDRELETKAEDSLDCSEIYPKRVGEVTEVIEVDGTDDDGTPQQWYDFTDGSLDFDYNLYLMDGETMTVIFQSGELAGREFDVNYYHEAVGDKAARRFEIVPDEIDGMVMPGGSFVPKAGDRYAVFGCMLPNEYICNDGDHSGAEWDMLRECVKYLYDNEEQKFTFTGKMDGIWSAQDWDNIGAKVRPGGFILFTDPRFQPDGELVRIVGVKDYVNSPQSPELELSNETVTPGFVSTVKEIESREMLVDERHRDSIQFTKRRFRDAQETLTLLEQTVDSLSGQFTEGVSPVSVQTMTMLVGDDALQFRFVTGYGSTEVAAHSVTWDAAYGILRVGEGYLQHLTIGVTTVTNEEGRQSQEYRTWHLPSADLTPDDTEARWLYAVVPQSADADVTQEGYFRMEKEAVSMSGTDDGGRAAYRLLVGILNSEYGGDRSFAQMYGYTEVSPGRITTGRIVSGDGDTYFDLDYNEIGGTINFKDGLISGVIGIGRKETAADGSTATVVKAGLSADGEDDDSVRIWAGSGAQDREGAAFRVTQDGSLYASRGVFSGFLRVAFHALTDDDFAGGAYALGTEYCNVTVPRTRNTDGNTVTLPYDGDDPSQYSGIVYNIFINYQKTESYNDTLAVDANGGLIHWYEEGVSLTGAMLSKIIFHGGFVQLMNIGSNEWIVSVNNSVKTEWSDFTVKSDDYLTLSPTSLTFTADGGTERVAVSSSRAWTVSDKPAWITVSPDSGGSGDTDVASSVRIKADPRAAGQYDSQTGYVTFDNEEVSAALRVTQDGATRYYTLTINVGFRTVTESATPVLTVDGSPVGMRTDGSMYTWSGDYEEGSVVTYTVAASGYATRSGSVTMTEDKEVPITLTGASRL